MKYSDIKQFHKSYYNIDVSWDFLEHWVDDMTDRTNDDSSFELNPDFQRGHVWTERQQSSYLEYTIQGGESGQEVHFNHPGWQDSYKGDMVCVDGLQRITAIRKFMAKEACAFGHKLKEFDNQRFPLSLRLKIHVGKLQTRKEVLEWYLQMNTGGTPHSTNEIERVKVLFNKAD